MSKEMLNALDTLEAEKGVSKEIVIEALEAAVVSAYKRHYGQSQNVEVEFKACICRERSNGRSYGLTIRSIFKGCNGNQSSL